MGSFYRLDKRPPKATGEKMLKVVRNIAFVALATLVSTGAGASETPGIGNAEIRIGGVYPFSGPASALGNVGKGLLAYVQSLNDKGGVAGKKINYIAYDDAYSPPRSVEQIRKLVESDEVAFIYGQLGTPGVSATAKFLMSRGIPDLAIVSGSAKFTDTGTYPLLTTGLVSYEVEGRIYAKYLKAMLPNSKYAILYQNDDLGKDYVKAFRSFFGADFENRIVALPYEVTEPTIDSQIVRLKSSGADALFLAATPKFAAQAIRKVGELGWKPTLILDFPSSSVASTLKPAGLDKSEGVIVGSIIKDPTDSRWDEDPGMKNYREFFAKYLAGADIGDTNYLTGYQFGMVLEQILIQCRNDFSRENVAKQAKNLKNLVLPTSMPGVTVNTSEKVNQLWTKLQLQRWTGTQWEQFGPVLDSNSE